MLKTSLKALLTKRINYFTALFIRLNVLFVIELY
jgi:hypothetical protein